MPLYQQFKLTNIQLQHTMKAMQLVNDISTQVHLGVDSIKRLHVNFPCHYNSVEAIVLLQQSEFSSDFYLLKHYISKTVQSFCLAQNA